MPLDNENQPAADP